MPNQDTIDYALRMTRILREPDGRIDTFHSTSFSFTLLSEPMDGVGHTRIRKGKLEAHKPLIMRPESHREISLEGFDEQGKKFLQWMEEKGLQPVFFQYGFSFKRSPIKEKIYATPIEELRERVLEELQREDDPLSALIEGSDEAWEVSLLKFSIDMIEKSSSINTFDWQRKGLL